MLDANRVGSTLGITAAVFYSLCSLFYIIWPQGIMTMIAMLYHGFELSRTPNALSIGGFIAGLICISFWGYIIGAVYALIWNRLRRT